jgi:hypothetical protein
MKQIQFKTKKNTFPRHIELTVLREILKQRIKLIESERFRKTTRTESNNNKT